MVDRGPDMPTTAHPSIRWAAGLAVVASEGAPSELNSVFALPSAEASGTTANDRLGVKLLRKEVIQPHLPVRLPCYDFTPIANPTFDGSLLAVRPPASGVANFRGVTGGVYKTRERIHRGVADPRLLATPTSRGRVADPDPNLADFFGIRSPLRGCRPLWSALEHVCSPGHKGHDDLTSSPPSSGSTPAVPLESPTLLAGN